VSLVVWCLQRYVRVGWFLLGFVPVRIGVSSRLVPTNICDNKLVSTKNYKERFCGFLSKGFPHKSCVPCYAINISHM